MDDKTIQRIKRAIEFAQANDMQVSLADIMGAILSVNSFTMTLTIEEGWERTGFTEEICFLEIVCKLFKLTFQVKG